MIFIKGHIYPVNSCFTQIFEWRTKNTILCSLQFFPEVAHNSLRIPWVSHVQRNPWVFQVFQVFQVWPPCRIIVSVLINIQPSTVGFVHLTSPPSLGSRYWEEIRVKGVLTSDDMDRHCSYGRQQCDGMVYPVAAAEAAKPVMASTDEWLHSNCPAIRQHHSPVLHSLHAGADCWTAHSTSQCMMPQNTRVKYLTGAKKAKW